MEVSRETIFAGGRTELLDLLQVLIRRNGLGQTFALLSSLETPSAQLTELGEELGRFVLEQMGGAVVSQASSELLQAIHSGSSSEHLRATVLALEFLGRGEN